tara:strand:+ start:30222 stop:30599 length:378 start_codon:yes stop_codon:yes gene_type:complete
MNKVILIAIILPMILAGCTTKPREVEASLPLVNSLLLPIGEKIPEQYQSELNNPNFSDLEHNKYTIKVGPIYSSGLGNQCRQLFIEGDGQQGEQRVVCSYTTNEDNVSAWYLVPNIVQSATSIQL